MTPADALKAQLAPLFPVLAAIPLGDAAAAERALEAALPFASLDAIARALIDGADAGWLTPKEATPTLRFGRLAKPGADTAGLSVDVVDMRGGPGAGHRHPNGEISLCVAVAGDPRFCGRPAGWVVYPTDSRHVPEVTGGRMVIAYFLPDGAMDWSAA